MTTKSLRALLEGLIDYAGLFPPAALSMQDAVRNYARYREGEWAWMLGKFVVPRERVREVPNEFPLSVLSGAPGSQPGDDDGLRVRRSREMTIETKATSSEGLDELKPGTYVEISELSLVDELAKRNLRAKIRTGGITADAFPSITNVAEFLRACKAKGIAFKATAGLHHPLRCVKPLTYEVNAPTGTMHGFLNVFLAAALLEHAESILSEQDPSAFTFSDEAASWHEHAVTTQQLEEMRRTFATSFGSCSFEEPIRDLQSLGWL